MSRRLQLLSGAATGAPAAGTAVRQSGALTGVLLYLGALALFASLDAGTKHLVRGLPVLEVMWARFGFHLLTVGCALRLARRPLPWRPRAPRLQCLRSLALAACSLLFIAALAHIPLAEATAINFAGPLFTVLLAVLWLGERAGWRKWAGVVAGMAGVLIILRPFGAAFHAAALFALASAAVNAVYLVLTRKLAAADSPQTTIFHTGLWAALAASLLVPFVWVPPDAAGCRRLGRADGDRRGRRAQSFPARARASPSCGQPARAGQLRADDLGHPVRRGAVRRTARRRHRVRRLRHHRRRPARIVG